MEALSVFDMLKVGVGPSSSHTLGPWRAVQRFVRELRAAGVEPAAVRVELYGSLALTGRGHHTDSAIGLAFLGHEPETVAVDRIGAMLARLAERRTVEIGGRPVRFDPAADIHYHVRERLPGHANGMRCVAVGADGVPWDRVYYSVGGGFVVAEGEREGGAAHPTEALPYPCAVPADLLRWCRADGLRIADMVRANERAWRDAGAVRADLLRIWHVMLEGVWRGCRTDGVLPGGLGVARRAAPLARALLGGDVPETPGALVGAVRAGRYSFGETLRWVSAFALAVNEENASLGRVVTAPTNGAAGVIPAVLMYHACFSDPPPTETDILDFLLVAGETGTFFKKGATISAAMGGCQAEIGVSSAMAAAALCEALGGTPAQALQAAEIAMEHHLGMTCDPIGGLVQVPCIERNTMGAVKAINAAELACAGDADAAQARVSLDAVIQTLRQTAEDMSDKYKETSQGGLAVHVSVRMTEC